MSPNSRSRDTRTGDKLESFIEHLLKETDYQETSSSAFENGQEMLHPAYAKQFQIGETIYGSKRYVDFIIFHPERWPKCLVLEAKWQQTSGSVDEKLPYLVECIKHSKYPTAIVLDGKGYREGARNWLHGKAGQDCLLHVFSMSDLQTFANEGKL